jgi:hypothetical protein
MNEGDESERFEPSVAFLAEFEKQAKPAALEGVYRYAAARVPMVARAGGRSDDVFAEELVQDALGDTIMGTLRWDPDKRTLAQHLIRAIRFRTKDEALRLGQFRHHALVSAGDEESSDVHPIAEEASMALGEAMPATSEQRAVAAEVMTELRRRAADDKAVLELLDAFEEGATSRDDVMHLTEMSAATYRNARRRLAHLVTQLPVTLRLAVREALA